MTRNSRLNSLSESKNKRLLFKVVKTNWTHNNRPFLDTAMIKDSTRLYNLAFFKQLLTNDRF